MILAQKKPNHNPTLILKAFFGRTASRIEKIINQLRLYNSTLAVNQGFIMKSFSYRNSDSKDYARNKTIHSWVENYLREFPDLRDNPQRLFLFLWKMQHPNFKGSIDGLIALDKEDKLINAETAIRASRRIQERNIELRGANWEKNRVHDTSPLPLWERTFALEITLREVV